MPSPAKTEQLEVDQLIASVFGDGADENADATTAGASTTTTTSAAPRQSRGSSKKTSPKGSPPSRKKPAGTVPKLTVSANEDKAEATPTSRAPSEAPTVPATPNTESLNKLLHDGEELLKEPKPKASRGSSRGRRKAPADASDAAGSLAPSSIPDSNIRDAKALTEPAGQQQQTRAKKLSTAAAAAVPQPIARRDTTEDYKEFRRDSRATPAASGMSGASPKTGAKPSADGNRVEMPVWVKEEVAKPSKAPAKGPSASPPPLKGFAPQPADAGAPAKKKGPRPLSCRSAQTAAQEAMLALSHTASPQPQENSGSSSSKGPKPIAVPRSVPPPALPNGKGATPLPTYPVTADSSRHKNSEDSGKDRMTQSTATRNTKGYDKWDDDEDMMSLPKLSSPPPADDAFQMGFAGFGGGGAGAEGYNDSCSFVVPPLEKSEITFRDVACDPTKFKQGFVAFGEPSPDSVSPTTRAFFQPPPGASPPPPVAVALSSDKKAPKPSPRRTEKETKASAAPPLLPLDATRVFDSSEALAHASEDSVGDDAQEESVCYFYTLQPPSAAYAASEDEGEYVRSGPSGAVAQASDASTAARSSESLPESFPLEIPEETLPFCPRHVPPTLPVVTRAPPPPLQYPSGSSKTPCADADRFDRVYLLRFPSPVVSCFESPSLRFAVPEVLPDTPMLLFHSPLPPVLHCTWSVPERQSVGPFTTQLRARLFDYPRRGDEESSVAAAAAASTAPSALPRRSYFSRWHVSPQEHLVLSEDAVMSLLQPADDEEMEDEGGENVGDAISRKRGRRGNNKKKKKNGKRAAREGVLRERQRGGGTTTLSTQTVDPRTAVAPPGFCSEEVAPPKSMWGAVAAFGGRLNDAVPDAVKDHAAQAAKQAVKGAVPVPIPTDAALSVAAAAGKKGFEVASSSGARDPSAASLPGSLALSQALSTSPIASLGGTAAEMASSGTPRSVGSTALSAASSVATSSTGRRIRKYISINLIPQTSDFIPGTQIDVAGLAKRAAVSAASSASSRVSKTRSKKSQQAAAAAGAAGGAEDGTQHAKDRKLQETRRRSNTIQAFFDMEREREREAAAAAVNNNNNNNKRKDTDGASTAAAYDGVGEQRVPTATPHEASRRLGQANQEEEEEEEKDALAPERPSVRRLQDEGDGQTVCIKDTSDSQNDVTLEDVLPPAEGEASRQQRVLGAGKTAGAAVLGAAKRVVPQATISAFLYPIDGRDYGDAATNPYYGENIAMKLKRSVVYNTLPRPEDYPAVAQHLHLGQQGKRTAHRYVTATEEIAYGSDEYDSFDGLFSSSSSSSSSSSDSQAGSGAAADGDSEAFGADVTEKRKTKKDKKVLLTASELRPKAVFDHRFDPDSLSSTRLQEPRNASYHVVDGVAKRHDKRSKDPTAVPPPPHYWYRDPAVDALSATEPKPHDSADAFPPRRVRIAALHAGESRERAARNTAPSPAGNDDAQHEDSAWHTYRYQYETPRPTVEDALTAQERVPRLPTLHAVHVVPPLYETHVLRTTEDAAKEERGSPETDATRASSLPAQGITCVDRTHYRSTTATPTGRMVRNPLEWGYYYESPPVAPLLSTADHEPHVTAYTYHASEEFFLKGNYQRLYLSSVAGGAAGAADADRGSAERRREERRMQRDVSATLAGRAVPRGVFNVYYDYQTYAEPPLPVLRSYEKEDRLDNVFTDRVYRRNPWKVPFYMAFCDPESLCEGLCCMHCQLARQFNMLNYGFPRVLWPLCCLVFWLDTFTCTATSSALACVNRSTVRGRYHLQGSYLEDAAAALCCTRCTAQQVLREMSARGDFPGAFLMLPPEELVEMK